MSSWSGWGTGRRNGTFLEEGWITDQYLKAQKNLKKKFCLGGFEQTLTWEWTKRSCLFDSVSMSPSDYSRNARDCCFVPVLRTVALPPTPFHPTTHRSELRSEFRPDGVFSALVAVQPFKLGKEAFIGDQTWCLGLGQWGSIWPILAVWRLQIMRMFEIQEISFHIWNGLWCCRI